MLWMEAHFLGMAYPLGHLTNCSLTCSESKSVFTTSFILIDSIGKMLKTSEFGFRKLYFRTMLWTDFSTGWHTR